MQTRSSPASTRCTAWPTARSTWRSSRPRSAPAGEGFFDANYHADMTEPATQDLSDAYKERYSDTIRTGAVLAHDAVRVIAQALQTGRIAPTRRRVRGRHRQGRGATLVASSGPITFDENGENQERHPDPHAGAGRHDPPGLPRTPTPRPRPVYPGQPALAADESAARTARRDRDRLRCRRRRHRSEVPAAVRAVRRSLDAGGGGARCGRPGRRAGLRPVGQRRSSSPRPWSPGSWSAASTASPRWA